MRDKNRKVPFIKNISGKPFRAIKINRNDLCKCGSGLKSKRCCNKETEYFQKKDKRTQIERYIEEKEKSNIEI